VLPATLDSCVINLNDIGLKNDNFNVETIITECIVDKINYADIENVKTVTVECSNRITNALDANVANISDGNNDNINCLNQNNPIPYIDTFDIHIDNPDIDSPLTNTTQTHDNVSVMNS